MFEPSIPMLKNKSYSEEQKNHFYQTYGRFCVSFESLVYLASLAPLVGLKTKGLYEADLAQTLIEGPSETAKPRIDKYRAIVNLLLEDRKEVKDSVDKVFSLIINELIPIRNDIIHGFWFIEASMPEVTEIIRFNRQSVNKDGFYVKKKGKSIEEIEKWEIVIKECHKFFGDLWSYFAAISMKSGHEHLFKFKERKQSIEDSIKFAKNK